MPAEGPDGGNSIPQLPPLLCSDHMDDAFAGENLPAPDRSTAVNLQVFIFNIVLIELNFNSIHQSVQVVLYNRS